jgi:SAM-dependent methyltransferase
MTLDSDLVGFVRLPTGRRTRPRARYRSCLRGHVYPVVEGVPVFLVEETRPSFNITTASLHAARTGAGQPFYLDTVGGISEAEKRAIEQDLRRGTPIDPVVSFRVLSTSGYAYASLRGKLTAYPIPAIPLGDDGDNRWLLDVGCNWGRWSLSAARKGWRPVEIDPSLGALLAARRMAAAEGRRIAVVCGDARFLPFKAESFDAVFSYSVLQHFDPADVEVMLSEMARVMRPFGVAKTQIAHRGGLRSTYHRTRPEYSKLGSYRVRYWKWSELKDVFERAIGPSFITPEAFGGIGLLYSDRKSLPLAARIVTIVSEMLKKLTLLLPPLKYLADSVFVEPRKRSCAPS